MKKDPDRAPDADSLVPWPLIRIASHMLRRAAAPELLLFFAEALEEAADHSETTNFGCNPYARGMRDLAAEVRQGVPVRDDTKPITESPQ